MENPNFGTDQYLQELLKTYIEYRGEITQCKHDLEFLVEWTCAHCNSKPLGSEVSKVCQACRIDQLRFKFQQLLLDYRRLMMKARDTAFDYITKKVAES